MAKPSSTFTWATDANFSTGPRSGQPTTVTPLAGELAQGFIPGSSFPSEWANYVLEIAGEWTVWANTYAAGLELNNTFTGSNTFSSTVAFSDVVNFNAAAHANSSFDVDGDTNLNGVSYLNDHAFFTSLVDFNDAVDVNDAFNFNSGCVISTVMGSSTNSYIDGALKLNSTSTPFTYNSGVSGATTYSKNYSGSIADSGGISNIFSITLADSSTFAITANIITWLDGSTPYLNTEYRISGYASGGSLTVDSDVVASGDASSGNLTHSLGTSGLVLYFKCTNDYNQPYTFNHMITYTIQAADKSQ